MTDIVVVSLLLNLDRSNKQCIDSSIYHEQTFVCEIDVQLTFKILGEMERPITETDLAPRNRS